MVWKDVSQITTNYLFIIIKKNYILFKLCMLIMLNLNFFNSYKTALFLINTNYT